MLSEKTINQVKARIDTINKKLKAETERALSDGKSISDVLDQLTEHAVREFTPESKMLMNSVYNVISNETLQTEFFQVTSHQAAFNKRNIQLDIENHFSFEIPEKIDYEDKHFELWASGAVALAGGGISLCVEGFWQTAGVIAIAAVLVYLMYKGIKEHKQSNQKQLIDQYLISIRGTLVRWLESIAEYYDQQVDALKSEIEKQEA